MFTGLLLARAGVACEIYEKSAGISTHPKAMGLSRRTCEIFRQCGLLEEILKGCLSLEGRHLAYWSKSLTGEELGCVPMNALESPVTPCTTLHCPQTWTEKVFLEALEKETLCKVHFGKEVTSVQQDGGGVQAHFADGSSVEASWLVATDGAGSPVRRALGIETDGPGDLGHFVNTLFRANYGRHLADRPAVLYHALGTDFFEFFVAVNGDDLWLMHHFLQPGQTPEDFPASRMEEIIRYVSGIPEVPVEVLRLSPWVMSPKVAKTWKAGRVFLAGDAAARLSPAGGLGLNTGLQGVHNLAWKLAMVVNGQASENLLETYESERRLCALHTMRNTNSNAEEIFAIVAAGMRGDWDAVREGIAHSRRAGSGLGQDLGLTYDEGAFVEDGSEPNACEDVINDYLPSGRPGGRAPHAFLDGTGDKKSLLDLFGERFVILAGRAGGVWRETGSPVVFLQNGADFECPGFEDLYGISSAGAVLVRPDGYIAARFAGPEAAGTPDSALQTLLGRNT